MTTRVCDFLQLLPELTDSDIRLSDTTEERFWKYVDVRSSSECWNWTGATRGSRPGGSSGYGIVYAGHISKSPISVYTHRLSWAIHRQLPIPLNYQVCHHCDNGLCVNPNHLFIGTPAENSADMVSKGRNTPTIVANTKLTDDMVSKAKQLYCIDGLSMREIARQFGVSPNTIDYHIRDCVLPGHTHNPGSKLTRQAVTSIYQRYASGNTSLSLLAREYGVDPSYISLLVNGKRRVTITCQEQPS